jgi:hypothetical protein
MFSEEREGWDNFTTTEPKQIFTVVSLDFDMPNKSIHSLFLAA